MGTGQKKQKLELKIKQQPGSKKIGLLIKEVCMEVFFEN